MGIAPITNLTPLTMSRQVLPELEPLPMARVEATPRMEDEKYSPSGGKSSRGSEDDGSGDELEGDIFFMRVEEEEDAPRQKMVARGGSGAISFFA